MAISQSRMLSLIECAEAYQAAFDRCRGNLEYFVANNEEGSPDYCGAQLALAWLPEIDWRVRQTLLLERAKYDATRSRNARQRRYLAKKKLANAVDFGE